MYPVRHLTQTLERIRLWRDNPKPVWGQSTGIEALDLLTGGLHDEELTILAARPSQGKTALAMQIAFHRAREYAQNKDDRWAVVFSAEMRGWQVVLRELSRLSRIPQSAIKRGEVSDSQFEALQAILDEMQRYHLVLDDTPSIASAQVAERLRALQDSGRKVGLVVFDYLQLAGDSGSDYEAVTRVSRTLAQVPKAFKCPVIALSQLSREVEKRDPPIPHLSDLRGSGSIEQDADNVLFIYREAAYDLAADRGAPHPALLLLEKSRNGAVGVVTVEFHPAFTEFRDRYGEAFEDPTQVG